MAVVLALAGVRDGAAQQSGPRWRFVAPQGADAWFSLLSGARFDGIGPLPFYRRSANAREMPAALRATLARDPAFEVLHFVPLYQPTADARQLAATLRAVASAHKNSPSAPSEAAFAVTALTAVLPTPQQRSTMASLAALIESAHSSSALPSASVLASLQARWDSAFAPRLAQYLIQERLQGGVIVLSPSLGAEGRFFAGRPENPFDNVIAVWSPSAATDAPIFAVVRELCFPLVSRAAQSVVRVGDRAEYARRTSLAAVRCGDSLMTRLVPEVVVGYRRHWEGLLREGARADPSSPTLAPATDPTLDAAVAVELRRTLIRVAPVQRPVPVLRAPHNPDWESL